MTRGLAITLLIAIVLLVNTVMNEGGPLDTIASNGHTRDQVIEGPDSDDQSASEVALATKVTPAPEPTADAIGWFNQGDRAEPAAPVPRVAEPRQSAGQSASTDDGALPRHRHNIEE